MSYYSKEDIERFKISDDATRSVEILINNAVNKYKNLIINHITTCNYSNKITLVIYGTTDSSCNITDPVYPYRDEILLRLKNIFPSMKVSTKYVMQDMIYFDMTFDWN